MTWPSRIPARPLFLPLAFPAGLIPIKGFCMITPVLLCGGSGTRLWPLSRKSFPKQFAPLIGETSLFQASVTRLSGTEFTPPVVVTGSDFRFIVTEQMDAIGVKPRAILIEPAARNTAPAILAAALWLAKTDPDQPMLVAPSDHVIPDAEAFAAAVARGLAPARAGQLVTFGIQPTHAETGYGWLELAESSVEAPVSLSRFVEKPDRARAEEMLAAGNFLWNAGIFLFTPATLIAAFEAHAPAVLAPVRAALDAAKTDLAFLRLGPEDFGDAPDISIDYAVMEKAENLTVVPFGAGWSDLGGWDAVWREMGPDATGVATGGDALAIDCENTLLRSETQGLELVGIGLKDTIVVSMQDAVLVADRSRAQEVKQAVAALKKKFPAQPFLIVRYGDHQPEFSPQLLDPELDEAGIGKKLMDYDPRYYATYYAIDAVNFEPVKSPAVMDTIDAAYLPLVIQEAAGIPLDPSFEEQKAIMLRCNGAFYSCKDGAEARRFNRLLIDAGIIKGL